MTPNMKTDRQGKGESHIIFWLGFSDCLHVWDLYQIHIAIDFI